MNRETRDISIIIVSYNTRDYLRRCLTCLGRSGSDLVREIVVIDNDSSDGSAEMVGSEFPDVRLVRNKTNVGYARAVNQGIRQSKGRYFLILNPDIETTEEAINLLWEFMENHQGVGVAGAKLLNPDGSLQMSSRTFYTLPVVLLRRTFLGRLFPNAKIVRRHLMRDWDHNSDRSVDWIIGACMMVRREAYDSVGGMDERFFLYFEDVDWCYRMKKHGWDVYYVHSAVMKHDHRRESARLLPDRKLISHLLSSFRFYDKWNWVLYGLKRERRMLSILGAILSDVVFINLSFILAYYFRYLVRVFFYKPLYPVVTYREFMIFVNIVCLVSFVYSGLYRKRRRTNFVRDLIAISRAILLSSLVIMAATYLTRTIAYSRIVVLVFWPISAVLVTAARALGRHLHRGLRRGLFDLRRFAIIGVDGDALDLRDRLGAVDDGAYDFVGFVSPPKGRGMQDVHPLIGGSREIGNLVVEHRLNEVLIADRNLSRDEIGKIVIDARRSGAEVSVVSEVTDMLIRGSLLEDVGGLPVVVFPPASLSGTRLATKYAGDFVAALLALAGLGVLTPVVLVWQAVTFRNFATWMGALGALVSVLAGKRSLVGPTSVRNGERLMPGVTGIWRTTADFARLAEKDKIDIYYLQNWSPSSDIEIMLLSLKYLPDLFRATKQPPAAEEGVR